MGRACSTNGGEEKWWEIQKGRNHWEDQDVGGWTILYNARSLMDATRFARLLMAPFNLLNWFISDFTSRHYNLSLQ
jgi:hypothetical protein